MKKTSIALFCILIFTFLILLVLPLFKEKPQKTPAELSNHKLPHANGIVTNIWLDDFSRLDKLKEHNIKYLFVDIGDTGENGRIETPEEEISSFLNLIGLYERQNNYDFILLPYSEINSYIYGITPSFIGNFVDDYQNLVSLGFDGLLVDIEPIPFDKRDAYIDLLEKLDNSLPNDAIISVYAGSLEDSQNEWEWNYTFYREVSEKADLISMPGYDLDLPDKEQYQDYIKEQVRRIASENWNSYFLFAVPTHKEFPETIENALSAYKAGLEKYPENNFLGICIFSEWTITNEGWATFNNLIGGR